jgi:hypothetical protein
MNLFRKIFSKKEVKDIENETITVNDETHEGSVMTVLSDKTLVDGKEVESNIHKDNNIDSTSSIIIS